MMAQATDRCALLTSWIESPNVHLILDEFCPTSGAFCEVREHEKMRLQNFTVHKQFCGKIHPTILHFRGTLVSLIQTFYTQLVNMVTLVHSKDIQCDTYRACRERGGANCNYLSSSADQTQAADKYLHTGSTCILRCAVGPPLCDSNSGLCP